MEIICATAASAALFVPGGPDMRSAAALVRRALTERGQAERPTVRKVRAPQGKDSG